MLITDQKEVYEIFKFFKDLFTSINKGNFVVWENDRIYFEENSYYILSGKVNSKNEFTKWMQNKRIKIPLETLKRIKSATKKNVVSIEFSEDEVVFIYKEKDESQVRDTFKNEKDVFQKQIERVNKIEENNFTLLDVPEAEFTKDLLEIYVDKDFKFSAEPTETKIFEMPNKRIISILSKAEKIEVKYCRTQTGIYFIQVSSIKDSLELKETFAAL